MNMHQHASIRSHGPSDCHDRCHLPPVLLLSSAKMALETNLAAWSHYIQPETAMQQLQQWLCYRFFQSIVVSDSKPM